MRKMLLLLALTTCMNAAADPWGSSRPNTPDILLWWAGSGQYHEEANDAGLYLESVSNYDGNPAESAGAAHVKVDNLLMGSDYGLTYCDGTTNPSNLHCQGQMIISINADLIAENNQNLRNSWCHEIGHMAGANHVPGYGLSGGCMHTYTHEYYHQHHIDVHLQWTDD